MVKILFILFFPLFLSAKFQAITYFPLETHIVKKITQEEIKIREISTIYNNYYEELPFSEVSRFSNAKVFFHFGLDVEKKYEEVIKNRNPELIVVDLSLNIEKINNNPYIWTDPLLLRKIAQNLYESLVQIDKNKASLYKKNYEKFLEEIDNTYLKIKQKLSNSEVNTIYVLDDYWEYFAKRYRIKTIKKDKKFLHITEIPDLLKFTQKNGIKNLLFYDNYDHNIAVSISSNLDVKMIEDSIFKDKWQVNLFSLTEELIKNK